METGIMTLIFESLLEISNWAVPMGGLIIYIFRQQEKTIERIDAKNDKIVDDLTTEKNNYYQLLNNQGTMIQELKIIAERQEETQKHMATTMNNQGVQLEIIKTQIAYLNKQQN